jgi:D-sedoheptulose 7-phosphate isomerase
MNQIIKQRIEDSISVKTQILNNQTLISQIENLALAIQNIFTYNGKIFFAGNGSSFADSMHLAAEFVSRFQQERQPLPAIALGANNANLIAIGNDYTFEDVFARELKALGYFEDIFIGISTGGNSENLIRAIDIATQDVGMKAYCLTGETGGMLKEHAECICVPSTITARIQEAHILIGHIVCELVEEAFIKKQQQQ